MNRWSRAEKLALLTLIVAILGTIATWASVPGLQLFIGLGSRAKSDPMSVRPSNNSSTSTENPQPKNGASNDSLLQFTNYGISFNYERSMNLSTKDVSDGIIITLKYPKSLIAMITIYSAPKKIEETQKDLIEGLQQKFKSLSTQPFQSSGRTIYRKIHGTERQGQIVEDQLAGLDFKTEVYTFFMGDKVVSLVLQNGTNESDIASRLFGIISDSLE